LVVFASDAGEGMCKFDESVKDIDSQTRYYKGTVALIEITKEG